MDWVNSLRFCIITRGYSSCFCARERKKQLTTAWNMRENGPKKYWKKVERRRCQQWRWNNFATRHRPSCLVKRCRRSDSEIVSLRDVSLRFRTWRMASSAMMKSWAILRTLKYIQRWYRAWAVEHLEFSPIFVFLQTLEILFLSRVPPVCFPIRCSGFAIGQIELRACACVRTTYVCVCACSVSFVHILMVGPSHTGVRLRD